MPIVELIKGNSLLCNASFVCCDTTSRCFKATAVALTRRQRYTVVHLPNFSSHTTDRATEQGRRKRRFRQDNAPSVPTLVGMLDPAKLCKQYVSPWRRTALIDFVLVSLLIAQI